MFRFNQDFSVKNKVDTKYVLNLSMPGVWSMGVGYNRVSDVVETQLVWPWLVMISTQYLS